MLLGILLASTLYVAPHGNDKNPGTLAAPFATISRGVTNLKPGDEVLVRGGIYRESVLVGNTHGTAGAPIHIRAYPHETPIIDGNGTRANGLVMFTSSSWLRFDGFEVRNGPKSGILLYDVQDIKLRGNDVHHHFRFGIHVVTGSEHRRGTTRRVLIERNKVHHNVQQNANLRAREWMQGIGTFRAEAVEIRHNQVYENLGEGIDAVVSNDVTIADNDVWDNFSANIYLDNATNVRVDGNRVSTGRVPHPESYYRNGKPSSAIFTANEFYDEQNPLRDITITNNVTVGGKYGFGYGNYDLGGGLHRTRIANNTFDGASDHVLYLEPGAHDTVTIENNIFVDDKGRDSAYAPKGKIAYRNNCWAAERKACGAGTGAAR